MVECKDFHKGIIQLEWEHKKMSRQIKDLRNNARDIQMLHVSHELQEVTPKCAFGKGILYSRTMYYVNILVNIRIGFCQTFSWPIRPNNSILVSPVHRAYFQKPCGLFRYRFVNLSTVMLPCSFLARRGFFWQL